MYYRPLIPYFQSFDIDITSLSNEIKDIETILPRDIKQLTVSHIQQIIKVLDEKPAQLVQLNKMITPISPLNSSGVLNRRIWRQIECFIDPESSFDDIINTACLLREETDINYQLSGRVMAQPRKSPGGSFMGLSCSINSKCFPNNSPLIVYTRDTFPTTRQELEDIIFEESSRFECVEFPLRPIISMYIDEGDVVSIADWVVELDNEGTGHVTISVGQGEGEGHTATRHWKNVAIPALARLPWKLCRHSFTLLKARADWTGDLLPDSDNDDRVAVFSMLNEILEFGVLDDFFTVWHIYDQLYRISKRGMSTAASIVYTTTSNDDNIDISIPLQSIIDVIYAYIFSRAYDINAPSPYVEPTLNAVEKYMSQLNNYDHTIIGLK